MITIRMIAGLILVAVVSFSSGYLIKSQSCKTASNISSVPTPTYLPILYPTSTLVPTAPISLTPTVGVQPETEQIFTNSNVYTVYNSPTSDTVFTTTKTYKIYTIQDYHWNYASGSTPGTIALRAADGTMYGPWQAEGSPGQGGVPNAYWTVYPDIELPAGTYTIIDSDSPTWAQNTLTNGAGMSQVTAEK